METWRALLIRDASPLGFLFEISSDELGELRFAARQDRNQFKKVFRRLVKKHHPDKGGHESNMKNLNTLYRVLKKNPSSKWHPGCSHSGTHNTATGKECKPEERIEESKKEMKLTKEKLQQIIQEELAEADMEIAKALAGKAGLGSQNEPTRAGRSGEKMNIELGSGVPNKEDVISAAELLKIIPRSGKDRLTVYNVATYLKTNPDASPEELVKVVMDAREEADYIGIDDMLQEQFSNTAEIVSGIVNYLVRNRSVALEGDDAKAIRHKLTSTIEELVNQYGRSKK